MSLRSHLLQFLEKRQHLEIMKKEKLSDSESIVVLFHVEDGRALEAERPVEGVLRDQAQIFLIYCFQMNPKIAGEPSLNR